MKSLSNNMQNPVLVDRASFDFVSTTDLKDSTNIGGKYPLSNLFLPLQLLKNLLFATSIAFAIILGDIL